MSKARAVVPARPAGTLLARTVDSPMGPLGLAVSGVGLVALRFGPMNEGPADLGVSEALRSRNPSVRAAAGVLEAAARQLDAYFDSRLRAFDLPLDLVGTPFQLRVWAALRTIRYGARSTYGDVARALGDPRLARAVGAAAGRNPVAIIVPCHRLVGSDGGLTGFGGGLAAKDALLRLEARWAAPDLFGPL